MEEFPANSKRSKQGQEQAEEPKRERRVETVVDGAEVTVRKRSLRHRVGDLFTGSDGQSVGSFLWWDMIVPMSRSMVYDLAEGAARRTFLGDSRMPSRGGSGFGYGGGMPTNYGRYSTPSAPPMPSISRDGRRNHDFGEISIPERHRAEAARAELYRCIEKYGVARVADFYDAVGITPNPQDDRWGWDDLGGGRIRRVADGFVLELPRPVPIDR